MTYHFINRYCKITVAPEPGITIHLTGWLTYATADMLLLTDEEGDEIPVNKNELRGSIEVLEEQREMKIEDGKYAIGNDEFINHLFRNSISGHIVIPIG